MGAKSAIWDDIKRCMVGFREDVIAFGREVGLVREPALKAKGGHRSKKNGGNGR